MPLFVRALAKRACLVAVLGAAAVVVLTMLDADDASAAPEPASLRGLVEQTVDEASDAAEPAAEPAVGPVAERLEASPLPVPSPLPEVPAVELASLPVLAELPVAIEDVASARIGEGPAPAPDGASGPASAGAHRTRGSAPDQHRASRPARSGDTDRTPERRRADTPPASPPTHELVDRFPQHAAVLVPPILLGTTGARRWATRTARPTLDWHPLPDARPG